jgi:exosortase K
VAALGSAWAIKAFYSRAGADDLRWILGPTMQLVSISSGAAFELEPGVGYLSRDRCFLVAPACAGVNFMIVAFVSLCLGLARTCSGAGSRVALVLGGAAAAYATTVLANAARIALALRLHAAGASLGPLTPARLHCALGVAVYFVFLLALVTLATRHAEARRGLAG